MENEKIKQFMLSNREITFDDFLKELERQQREVSYSSKSFSLTMNEKQIIEMEEKKICKIFSSYIRNCDFINMNLSDNSGQDQRTIEGNIFVDCSFINCSNIVSMNECIFIGCTFNNCNFRRTSFIKCTFENSSAGDCDFRMANFSLSNYHELYISGCEVEGSLLLEKACEAEEAAINDPEKIEISVNMLEASLRLIYDSMRLNEDAQLSLDPLAHDLNEYIREAKKKLEKDGIRDREESDILSELDLHEAWANQIYRINADMPDIDWTHCNYSNMNFSERNLSGIDFTGSIMKNCDFTACNLTGVNFCGCNLTGSVLYKSIMAQNKLDDAKLENITIDKKNLQLFESAGVPVNTNQTGPSKISVIKNMSRNGKRMV